MRGRVHLEVTAKQRGDMLSTAALGLAVALGSTALAARDQEESRLRLPEQQAQQLRTRPQSPGLQKRLELKGGRAVDGQGTESGRDEHFPLLLDEAEAAFGRKTDVQDAHDRYGEHDEDRNE